MRTIRHLLLLTAVAVCSIPQRLGTSLVTVISITAVVGVLVAMLALGQGLERFVETGISPEQAVVIANGAQSALQSALPRSDLGRIGDKPGVKRDADGKPLVDGEVFRFIDGVTRHNQRGTVSLYGATREWREVTRGIHIVEGRFFRPGLHELIVSDLIRRRFRHLNLGDEVQVRGSAWKIVGVFEAENTAFDDSLIGDADTVLSAFPGSTFNAVNVSLTSPAAFATFKKAVTGDPTLSADVKTAAQASQDIIKPERKILDFIGYFIGTLMGLGAACGALASLFATVDARKIEIATLRAMGFSSVPAVVSVLAEGMLLALPAALIGAGIDWYLFNGHVVSALQITFPMAVTPHLVLVSILWSLSIALLGGILPSVRAARMPVAAALRAS